MSQAKNASRSEALEKKVCIVSQVSQLLTKKSEPYCLRKDGFLEGKKMIESCRHINGKELEE